MDIIHSIMKHFIQLGNVINFSTFNSFNQHNNKSTYIIREISSTIDK